MGVALYRKYRPKSLADVVGQDPIIKTLQHALKKGAISHAYLFTGPRGVGKTSIARILAHEINKLPYTEDATHLDIIEIDAASNRRIDEIRDLRDKVHIAPTSAPYKVYIIDEVHMLTREAFNALLKTLEEPPAHVVFILATTEAHKVPDTIVSRTQRFTFRPIEQQDAIRHLAQIAKKEKITIDEASLALLSDHAKGSFRDSINLLDQLSSTHTTITTADVEAALGITSNDILEKIITALKSGDPGTIIETVDEARLQGVHAGQLTTALMSHFRAALRSKQELPTNRILDLIDNLLSVQSAHEPYLALELCLLRFVETLQPVHIMQQPAHTPQSTPVPVAKVAAPAPPKPPAPIPPKPEPTETPEPIMPAQVATPAPLLADAAEVWNTLLTSLKGNHNTLYGTLRMAQPVLDDSSLTLTFKFAFHQKQLSQAHNIEKIRDALYAITGKSMQITCVVGEATPVAHIEMPTPEQSSEKAPLTDVSNIFDGAELLE